MCNRLCGHTRLVSSTIQSITGFVFSSCASHVTFIMVFTAGICMPHYLLSLPRFICSCFCYHPRPAHGFYTSSSILSLSLSLSLSGWGVCVYGYRWSSFGHITATWQDLVNCPLTVTSISSRWASNQCGRYIIILLYYKQGG